MKHFNQEQQQVIEKLEAQKERVKPSPELLRSIIAQLPEHEDSAKTPVWASAPWIRFALPLAMAGLVVGIFVFSQQGEPSSSSQQAAIQQGQSEQAAALNQQSEQQPLSISAIAREEQQLEEFAYEEFFEDELQMQEIDATLANF